MHTDRPTAQQRYDRGRQARSRLGRRSLGYWDPASRRHDPLEILHQADAGRVPALLPLKARRMAETPFTFFRGAAALMAADLGPRPNTGLHVQICGDAHIRNLGAYAAPDGHLVFDLTDFDEALPEAPWEWDVLRLATSFILAGIDAEAKERHCQDAVRTFVRTYRESLATFGAMKVLDFARFEVRRRTQETAVRSVLQKAELATPARSVEKLCEPGADGFPRLREKLPETFRLSDSEAAQVLAGVAAYPRTLQADRRQILQSYAPAEVAFKVVGTGSVGTRTYVVLLFGRGPDDPLFLQLKEARPSCWRPYVENVAALPAHEGQRVAESQLRAQTATDPFLGWTSIDHRPFQVRQLADRKAGIEPQDLKGDALVEYAFISGQILAKAHARTGDALALSGYCGEGDRVDEAVLSFAESYARQTKLDHAVFRAAAEKISEI